jgi:hypothetical protein
MVEKAVCSPSRPGSSSRCCPTGYSPFQGCTAHARLTSRVLRCELPIAAWKMHSGMESSSSGVRRQPFAPLCCRFRSPLHSVKLHAKRLPNSGLATVYQSRVLMLTVETVMVSEPIPTCCSRTLYYLAYAIIAKAIEAAYLCIEYWIVSACSGRAGDRFHITG